MRKWMSWLLAMTVLFCTAHAETGTVQHTGEDGYFLRYDPAWFRIDKLYGHDVLVPADDSQSSMMIVPAEVKPEDVDSMLREAVGGYGPDAVIGKPESAASDGTTVSSVQAELDGTISRFYLVDDGERVLCVTATIPAEEEALYGAAYDAAVESIRFVPVRQSGNEGGDRPEALFAGDGFSIWYPVGQMEPCGMRSNAGFVPAGSGEGAGISLTIVKSEASPGQTGDMLAEAVGGFTGEFAVARLPERLQDGGLSVSGIDVRQGESVHRFYAVTDGQTVYCLTGVFPAESEIDCGAILERMVFSMELAETE